jgi:hypothetical protein
MCIICSNQELGIQYLVEIAEARSHLKQAEKALLKLGKLFPESNYDSAHKKLVKIRKSIDKVEKMREDDKH